MRALPDPFVLAVLLVDVLALLFFFSRLPASFRAVKACAHSDYSTAEALGNNYLCNSVRLCCLLLLPLYALTLVVTDVSVLGFGWTLALLALLVLFRPLACLTMGWLGSQQATFRALERVSEVVLVGVMAVSLPALLVGWLVPSTPRWLLWGYLAVVAAAGALLYVWRGTSIILQKRFSSFFWVLYLCGLEFLPICVVANILINGN